MSWIPLLLALWVVADLVVVAAIVAASKRRRAQLARPFGARPAGRAIGAGATGRLVH